MSGRGVRKRGRPPKSVTSQRGSRFNYHLLKKPKYLMKGSDSQFSTPSLSRGSSPQESETSRKSISRAYFGTKSSRGRGRRGKSVNTSTSRKGYESEYHYGSDFGDSTDKSDPEDDLLLSPTDEESESNNEESESEYSECSFGPTTGLGRPPRPPSPEPVWLQDREVPPLEVPQSSEDLLLSKEHILDAVAIYEVLRRFRNLVRLSPFRFEDFCAALISEEQSSLLTEVHLMLLKAILREEDLQATHFGPLDQKDSINITLYLIDHITWPEVLRNYIESDDFFDKTVLRILSTQEYPFSSIEDRMLVLKFLTDQFLITTGVRDDMLQEGPIHYDDHCRICHRLGDLLCCETCPAVFHLECVDPPLTKIPTEDWQCNICKSHKTVGVSDCVSQQEKQGLSIRQDILGYDRHGRKYWFVCRRIFVEDQDGKSVWYYSSTQQLNLLLSRLDDKDLEQRLCQEINELKEEIQRQMKITENLTNDQKGNKKSYLEIENEKIQKLLPKGNENGNEENISNSDSTNNDSIPNLEPEQRLTRQKSLQISTGMLHFKLGMENGFKTYVNQYSINPIALNKPQRNEERDKKRHLSHKFSLTTASAFKWVGGGLNSTEQNIVSTLRQTLLSLEQSITSPFMNPNWNNLRKIWLSAVSNCIKPADFANALVLYQACVKNIVFANVWHEQLGHLRLQRITSVEREEKKKSEKREKRDRDDEEERNRLAFNYVKYSLGLKHQVWKQKGEEYRIHGQWGWIWMSYNRRIAKRYRIMDKIIPIKIMLKVKKDATEKVIAVDPKTYAFLQQSEEIIKKSGNYGYIDDFKKVVIMPVPETFTSINVSQALSSSSRLFYPKIARKSKLDNFLFRRIKLQKAEEQYMLENLTKKEILDSGDTKNSEEDELQNSILEIQTVLEKQINKLAVINKPGGGINSSQSIGNVNLDLVNSLAKKIQLIRSQFSKLNRFAKHYRCYAKECNTNSNAVSQITQNTCYSALCLQKARSKKELLLMLRKAKEIGNGSKETVAAILGALKKPSILEQKLMEGKKEASNFAVVDESEENRWNDDAPTNLQQDFLHALNNAFDFDMANELSSINLDVEEVKFETFDDCAEVTVKSEEIKSEDDVRNLLEAPKKNEVDIDMNEVKNVTLGVPLNSAENIEMKSNITNNYNTPLKSDQNHRSEVDVPIDVESSVSQFDDLLESDIPDSKSGKRSKTWKTNSEVSLTRSNENSLDNQLVKKIKKDIDSQISQAHAGKINRRFPTTKTIKKENNIPKYVPELGPRGIEKIYSSTSARGKVYLLHEYDVDTLKRKTSKNFVSKFPLIQSFLTHKLTKSLLCLQRYELLKLARLGGKGTVSGYNALAKVNNTVWSYPCGRPFFRTCWLYRTFSNTTLSAICLQFRILWCCLRWDDMTTKPPSADGKHQITTETEIVTTELLKLKHCGRFLEKTQYLRRKVTIPLEVPKTIREVTSIRSGLRKRKRAESPQQTEPQVTEEWIDEDKLELWEVKLFGEKQEKAVTRTVTGRLPVPKSTSDSSSSATSTTSSASSSNKAITTSAKTPSNEAKDKMEHQLKLQRAVQNQNTQKRVINAKPSQQQSDSPKPLIIGNRKVILKNPDGTTKVIHQPVSSTSVKTQLQVKAIPTNKTAVVQPSPTNSSSNQQPTQQKVQIIRGSDGKVSVRGLSPGQQLIQMPDGKLHVLTTTPGSGNKTIAFKPTGSSPVLSKIIENKPLVKNVVPNTTTTIKSPNVIKQYTKPTASPAPVVKQQVITQKPVQTQKVIVTGNQVITPAASVPKIPISNANSQPVHKISTTSSVSLAGTASPSAPVQKIASTTSSNLQQIIIQPGQKILVGQNAQGQKVLISPSPQATGSLQSQQQFIVSSAQPVQQIQQVQPAQQVQQAQQIHQTNVAASQQSAILNTVNPNSGQQKVVQQIVNTSNVQQQIVYEGQRIVLNPGQAIVTRTLVQNQSPKPRPIQVVQQQIVQPAQQIQSQQQQQQQQQQIIIQNQAGQQIIDQKPKLHTQHQMFTQNHKKIEQPTQQLVQQPKADPHKQQLITSPQPQIHQQQRELDTQKQLNAKHKQIVVQNSTVAQQLAQGKLQVATVNGQQVIIRPIGNNQAQIVAHIKTQSDGSSHIITNINALENDLPRKQVNPIANQSLKSPQQSLHQQPAQTQVINQKQIIQQQQQTIHSSPQTNLSTNLIQSESSIVQQTTQQIYQQTQQIKQQIQPQQQIQQQIVQNSNQNDLNNSIEQSLLHGQPPGTVIKCVTAQVIQTEHGPRIVLQGLAGNDFTPQQLALVQQQVKQQLLKAQESSGKQGVLGPTKIYLAVQPSTTTVNQQQQCQPPPLAPVQTTLQHQ
ncbi:nucleosome-remodeling factor subunit NURF301 isoform X2 [Condylostylus longicornis]|nr:nucleosome-remodeling factor subunit NURF301 isoform X2 [Condylostylus longicornis]